MNNNSKTDTLNIDQNPTPNGQSQTMNTTTENPPQENKEDSSNARLFVGGLRIDFFEGKKKYFIF